MRIRHTTSLMSLSLFLLGTLTMAEDIMAEDKLLEAVSFYASFDQSLKADFGGGGLLLRTRQDHPTEKGEYVFKDGVDPAVFRIDEKKGVAGGALECLDVIPRRGRIFYPAAKNLAYNSKGWGAAVSLWLNTNPNTVLKSPYCDPIQITHKGAHDGGIWLDFPDLKPREMRMGLFPGLKPGEKPVKESDPEALLIHYPRVPFEVGNWHHVVMSWTDFDTGKSNATAQLYVDGRLIGELKNREISMKWEIEKTGIYIAVSYLGLFDELTIFNRALSEPEIKTLFQNPDWANTRKSKLQTR